MEKRFLILFWRNAVHFFEYADKIINILISAGGRDGADGERGGIDQGNRAAYADLMDVIGQRYFYFLFKQPGEISFCQIKLIRKKGETQIFCIMEINIGNDIFDDRRISLHCMILDKKAILVNHVVCDACQLPLGACFIDQDSEFGGRDRRCKADEPLPVQLPFGTAYLK